MKPEKVIAIDIETGPMPLEKLERLIKVGDAPGNYKKEESIENWKRQEFYKQVEKAALNPRTGELLAFAYEVDGQFTSFMQGEITDERDLLSLFWQTYEHYRPRGYAFAGSNFKGFDIPFLYVRSLAHRIIVPNSIQWAKYGHEAGCYDLNEWWNVFPRHNKERISLDAMAQFFGHDGKNGDGALFYKMFYKDPSKAYDYLKNDIEMTRLCINNLCPPDEPKKQDEPELLGVME